MTECTVSQEHIVRVYTIRLLTYMEEMAEDAMIDLEAAEMQRELQMLGSIRDKIQNALEYFDPDGHTREDTHVEDDEEEGA